jgi:hypothetical protein
MSLSSWATSRVPPPFTKTIPPLSLWLTWEEDRPDRRQDISISNTFMSNKDKTFGLGIFERILIVTIILIFCMGIATLVGQPLPGFAITLFVMGYMVYIGFIPLWIILPSMVLGFMFTVWRSGG